MIELSDYWMGRQVSHGLCLSTDIQRNARLTVEIANKLLGVVADAGGLRLHISPRSGTLVASGWRPPAVNECTPGAAVNSKHLTGQAIDIYDPDGDLDEWCLAHADTALAELGLWLEHPSATKGWCHLQTIPPNSKRRVFYP